MRSSVRILLIAAACLALPATASAAAPFTTGTGSEPTVAVGSDGSGHVAWETDEANVKVGYCRLSPGGTTCNNPPTTALLPFSGTAEAQSAGRAQVFTPAANKVVIVAGCWNCPSGDPTDRVYRWTSTDNGDNFSGPTPLGKDLGNGNSFGGFGAWLDSSSTFIGVDGSDVKAQNGATPGEGVDFATGGLYAYDSAVTRLEGTNTLVAATNDLETIKYGVYNGPSLNVADINNAANWSTNLVLPAPEGDNSDTALNSGPNGIYMTYSYFVPNNSRVGLRHFDPVTKTFGGPIYIEGSDPIDDPIGFGEPNSFQDPSGRIHVVWESQYDTNRLRYTVSDTSGDNFSTPATLAANEDFLDPEISAGADGHGFATWTNLGGAIRIVPLDPYAESAPVETPPAPPPPAPTPAPSAPHVGGFRTTGGNVLQPGQATVFRFNASSAGLAVLTFEKRFKGIKGKRRIKRGPNRGKRRIACLPLTRKRLRALRRRAHNRRALRRLLRRRSCHGFRRIGQIRRHVARGRNAIRFNGRLAGHRLSPGVYRAKLIVRGGDGLVSRAETLRFKVVARHHKGKRKKRRHRH